jgi:hypothetical protein
VPQAARRRAIAELIFFAGINDARRCKEIASTWNINVRGINSACLLRRLYCYRPSWAEGLCGTSHVASCIPATSPQPQPAVVPKGPCDVPLNPPEDSLQVTR